jgi:ribosome-binding protein aMBF1 (putative translation factor)
MKYSEKLKKAIEARGCTSVWVARKLGIQKTTVWTWEKGHMVPSRKNREKLSEIFPDFDLLNLDSEDLETKSGRIRLNSIV